jgi:hypothetical protein
MRGQEIQEKAALEELARNTCGLPSPSDLSSRLLCQKL